MLRNWWRLAEWLREERFVLERLEQVKRAAEEWEVYEHSRDLLVHRDERLEAAEALLKRPDLARALAGTPLEYLDACRANEQVRNEKSLRRQSRWRFFRRLTTAMFLVLGALVVWAAVTAYQTRRQLERNVSWLLANESRKAAENGQSDRALRLAVLATEDTVLSPAVASAPFQLGSAALATRRSMVLRGHSAAVTAAAFLQGDGAVFTASLDGTVRTWQRSDRDTWRTRELTQGVRAAAASPDGAAVAVVTDDGVLQVWNTSKWTRDDVQAGIKSVDGVVPAPGMWVTTSRNKPSVHVWTRSEGGAWSATPLSSAGGRGVGRICAVKARAWLRSGSVAD